MSAPIRPNLAEFVPQGITQMINLGTGGDHSPNIAHIRVTWLQVMGIEPVARGGGLMPQEFLIAELIIAAIVSGLLWGYLLWTVCQGSAWRAPLSRWKWRLALLVSWPAVILLVAFMLKL